MIVRSLLIPITMMMAGVVTAFLPPSHLIPTTTRLESRSRRYASTEADARKDSARVTYEGPQEISVEVGR